MQVIEKEQNPPVKSANKDVFFSFRFLGEDVCDEPHTVAGFHPSALDLSVNGTLQTRGQESCNCDTTIQQKISLSTVGGGGGKNKRI